MSRLRGCPAASLSSVISACWMSVCLAAPRDLRCLRPLRHPAPVVAWLQGGVSAVGSRAFPFRPFRAVARVCFRQPGCLYAVRKSGCLPACRQCVPSTVWSVSRVVGFWAAAGEPGEIPAATVWVPGGQSPPRPGHLASRRRVGARHSVSPSGSLTLRLRKNRAVSLFLRRWKLRVVVPGGCLAIWVFDSSKPARSWAVGFPSSAPIRVPDALPPGGVPSSLPSGSPPVLSLLLAALVPSSWPQVSRFCVAKRN